MEQKKWSEMTPKEKKRFSCLSVLFSIVVLFIVIGYLVSTNDTEAKEKKVAWNEVTDQLRSINYRIDELSNDTMYWWNCQPRDSRDWNFTDRIQICGKDPADISALRIEAVTYEKGGLVKNNDVLNHFMWIGAFLPDTTKACTWIRQNFNKKNAELMLNEHIKLKIMAPVENYRRLDVLNIDEWHGQSPIPDDSLFWSK